MKRNHHTPEEIIRKLRIAEQLLNRGQSVVDVCRALEVSAPTYLRCHRLFGGTKATEAKRLKVLEQAITASSACSLRPRSTRRFSRSSPRKTS
jgi:transposase-like protein